MKMKKQELANLVLSIVRTRPALIRAVALAIDDETLRVVTATELARRLGDQLRTVRPFIARSR
jgi:hypothetical protein